MLATAEQKRNPTKSEKLRHHHRKLMIFNKVNSFPFPLIPIVKLSKKKRRKSYNVYSQPAKRKQPQPTNASPKIKERKRFQKYKNKKHPCSKPNCIPKAKREKKKKSKSRGRQCMQFAF